MSHRPLRLHPGATLFYCVALIAGALLAMMLLNGGLPNHALTPVLQYTSLFPVVWAENPLVALHFMAGQSLFALAHRDSISGLNLWTLEVDTYSLLLYLLISAVAGPLLLRALRQRAATPALYLALLGTALAAFAATDVTVLDHCAGATWAGIVALYGLGFDGSTVSGAWQWLTGGVGIALLGWGRWRLRVSA